MIYQSSFAPKLIYIFRINDDNHKGCLKVGDATLEDCAWTEIAPNSVALNKAAHKRIKQYTQTAGIQYELLYTEPAFFLKNKRSVAFRDSDVHNVLKRSGFLKKDFNGQNADEWFIAKLADVKDAIQAVKDGKQSINPKANADKVDPIIFRPEQREAIDKTVKRFKKGNQMLWNAKMRFGKTLCALQVVREMSFTRTLILTHRPVVNDGWFKDFNKIFADRPDFCQYGSKEKGQSFKVLENIAKKNQGRYIYFASMQDLRGSEKVGGNFDKNNELFKAEWDCIIVDEAHEGTKTELGQAVIDELRKDNTKILQLSGTPFNLLDDYAEDEIYTWDYVMEQKAKAEWDITHFGDPNPYSVLPRLNIYTFDLGKLVKNFSDNDLAFNFHEFFRCDDEGDFIHEGEVKSFLNLICRKDNDSNYPFSTDEFRNNFRHSLWMLPGVAAAKALSKMLKDHKVFGNYTIVNVAGDGDEEEANEEALKKVQNAIGKEPENTYTITLSCGRLTTGVSVPEWTAVFMLSGSANTAAAGYMQTIFRVQTPATINGKIKEECFVFDFAPDRTLKVLAETAKISAKAGKTTESDKKVMGEFLNFCPVIGFDGTKMRSFDVEKMLGQLKRVQIERVVRNGFEDNCLYNDNLLKLDNIELKAFEDLKKIIGTTKAMKKTDSVDINKSGLTDEEYEELEGKDKKKKKKDELTPEEKERLEKLKEARKNRDAAASILRGISIRMPLMIYGANLTNEEEQLTIDNFANLVDDTSWEEFMPKGVTKEKFELFKKYYEADIFKGAGKRIREMARAADALTIEERINRIGHIFNSFRNPDKETVLTPWRVVNMHIGDALGGYVFFDESFDNEKMLENPRFVNKGAETKNAFDVNAKILEINSKSGLYPLYMAYTIYHNEVKRIHGKMNTISIDMQQKLWDKVVADNIFVVCKTPMAVSITKRTLMGFRKGKVNAECVTNLIDSLRVDVDVIAKQIQNPKFWHKTGDDMKFNAVVGNPPYQVMANGDANGSDPIYHLFIDVARRLAELGTFIHPGRFLFDAGKTPSDWNKKMLNDEHFKVIRYWSDSSDVFPTVDIKGGVAVTMWNENEKFEKIGTFVAHEWLKPILKNVVKGEFVSLMTIMNPQSKFNLDVLFRENPKCRSAIGSDGNDKRLRPNAFDKLSVFTEKQSNGQIAIHGLIKNKRFVRYINKAYIADCADLNKYKTLVTAANGTGAIGETLSTPIVAEKNVGYTGSFIGIGCFDNSASANNVVKYIKTKFLRAMLGTLKVTQHNPIETWANVPLQDFSSNSDIDWSVSIAEIDQQLYKKYGLSKTDIKAIEENVKEM